ncbi:MAG: hypothetical protein A2788_01560 [Candidatus Abawacabacteria bacterium RIFCSPHIGHO2_01_FULL_46_8]|uniref:YtxH domain-containing protein n=1 Tax=Candidatus Abawacabacteria bacterium RIFCSPHIGHO2_01_FULL_46_8 TaxID=1817815 RepID=A0A1F4XLL5_9BACT|nr:MAG: hypothetical protein A2788_01560 [Candidatus Abawacabacteria bacterium RIFCSPHIGHO2_01_FULL_46_8]
MGERSSFSKLLFLLGATLGALFGLGFAQRKGEDLRRKLREATKQGKNPAEAIARDLLSAGKEVVEELERLSEHEGVEHLKAKITAQTRRLGEEASKHLSALEQEAKRMAKKTAKQATKKAGKLVKLAIKKRPIGKRRPAKKKLSQK